MSTVESKGVALIADDCESVRSAFGDVLSGRGYEVTTVADADQAIAFISGSVSGRIVLVLTDYSMPPGEKTGLDVARAAKDAGVPKVAIVTGWHKEMFDPEEFERMGVRLFSKRDAGFDELMDWIREI